jgi:hypothetical protein
MVYVDPLLGWDLLNLSFTFLHTANKCRLSAVSSVKKSAGAALRYNLQIAAHLHRSIISA